ncbi:MAG: hypothetical protein LBU51_00775, partial [Bacteroidales bacterium]|nr:hypothetical protein [Bacteroidales bacterium]
MYLPIYTKPLWWYKYPDISEKNNIVSFIQSCRNENGGFGNYRNNPPYLENLFYASVILSLLNETDKITDSTISYLLKSQCKDGGFGELGAERSNLFNTFYAVTSLKIYDKITPEIREQVLRYLKQDILHQDGIYDLHVGIKNTTTMFWCIAVLKSIIINEPIEGINIYDELVEFCMQCYNSNIGLFSSVPNGISTIQNTYECLVILKECSSLKEVDSQKIYESIMKRKREALFFDDLMQSYTLSSSMWAILSLTILGKLNKIDTTDVLSHSVKILTKTRSIFDMFCAVNIMIDMLYEKSNVYVDNTAIIEEQGETVSLKNIKDMIIKMEKKGYNYLEYNFKDLLLESKIEESNKKDIFIQVLLKEHEQRIYEIEYDVKNNAIFSLVVPVTRVTNQCIEKRIISANKIILLGVFDALSDLPYSKNEEQIIKKYCLDNNFFN